MLVQVTLMLAAAALATAQYDALPPQECPVGTDVTKGNLYAHRTPIKGYIHIPKNVCHTVIPRSKYECSGWTKLVALRVLARAESGIPPKVDIVEHFDHVTIDGCGPIKVYLEHACPPVANSDRR